MANILMFSTQEFYISIVYVFGEENDGILADLLQIEIAEI